MSTNAYAAYRHFPASMVWRPRQTAAMAYPRKLLVDERNAGTFHCVSRCVRRAFLCGIDRYTGQSFEHRKAWVEKRLMELADIFAVALYGYAVMSNHLHVVLHVDPDAASRWTEVEVGERWCRLFPQRDADDAAAVQRIGRLIADGDRVALCRARLASLSWFMRCLNEPIARRANAEDQCTGRFWEGRFKCQSLLDNNAILAAMAYVDLNPIRAGMTTRLERSRHTSVVRRMKSLSDLSSAATQPVAPLAGIKPGFDLSIRAADYIDLVDWTGRQLRPGKKGRIPKDAPHALDRLGLQAERWTAHVRGVGSGYWRAVGAVQCLLAKAEALGQGWLKGISLARSLVRV